MTYQARPMTDQKGNAIHMIVAWAFAVLTLGYFLPWAIAATRRKSNTLAIALLTLLLGWTLVGWIIALVMACGTHQVVQPVAVNNSSGHQPQSQAHPGPGQASHLSQQRKLAPQEQPTEHPPTQT